MTTLTQSPPRLLRRREVEARTGLSRTSIYRNMRNGSFPAPIRVGPRAVRWLEQEIEAWLAGRPRAHGDLGYPAVAPAD